MYSVKLFYNLLPSFSPYESFALFFPAFQDNHSTPLMCVYLDELSSALETTVINLETLDQVLSVSFQVAPIYKYCVYHSSLMLIKVF